MKSITLPYPRDALRYKYFTKESNIHQAKFELRTFKWCVEQYTKPGDTILDPMSGVGTIHFANFMGRNTVAIELVPMFAELQENNWEYMNNIWKSSKFYTQVEMGEWDFKANEVVGPMPNSHTILIGDARRHLPLDTPVDAVIFSPPYGNLWAFNKDSRDSKISQEKNYVVGYDDSAAQVGNLKNYTQYLHAMKQIYQKCYDSLKPGAPLVTVVKDYIQQGKRVYCSRDNWRLCMNVGFLSEAWHFRDASVQNNPYSARNREKRIAAGKHTVELDIKLEDIIVMRKPNA